MRNEIFKITSKTAQKVSAKSLSCDKNVGIHPKPENHTNILHFCLHGNFRSDMVIGIFTDTFLIAFWLSNNYSTFLTMEIEITRVTKQYILIFRHQNLLSIRLI